MSVIFYMLFSSGLYIWTVMSIEYDSKLPLLEYLLGTILLAVFVIIIWNTDRDGSIRNGIVIAAVFMNLGLSIAYRMWTDTGIDVFLKDGYSRYVGDLCIMMIVFVVLYLVIRYTSIYRFKFYNLLLMLMLPIVLYGARICGEKEGGSYLYFCGMMTFGLVLMGFPFVAAYFVAKREDRYRGRYPNVRNLPQNLIGLLIYMFILYSGCVICNEFGLLLILGMTTTVLFFIRCKNGLTKLLYSVACASGAVLAGLLIVHIKDRIQIWLNPAQAYQEAELAGKAESIVYLFRHIYATGWWGRGIGSLPEALYPTLNTDHALVTLLHEYSLFVVIAVLILMVIFVRWLLRQPDGLCVYDQYLNLTSALIVMFIVLVDVASNLGSFIIAGIGFPWISEGSSVNIMLTALLAIQCGLTKKGKEVRK